MEEHANSVTIFACSHRRHGASAARQRTLTGVVRRRLALVDGQRIVQEQFGARGQGSQSHQPKVKPPILAHPSTASQLGLQA